jgi:hypothetical protein
MKVNGWPMKYVLPATLVLLGLILIVGAASRKTLPAYSSLQKTVQTIPVINNKTKSITVTDIKLAGNGIVEVTLLNGSSRVITFYTFALGAGQIMPLGGIPAGGTTVQKFSANTLAEAAARNGSGISQLTILALSFGGGGGEGDPEEVTKLEETTLGMKEEIRRFLPALVRAANSPAVESEENLLSFETEASELAAKIDPSTLSPARKGGQELAKLLLSKDLQSLRDKKKLDRNNTYKNGLAERLKYYQRRFTEL